MLSNILRAELYRLIHSWSILVYPLAHALIVFAVARSAAGGAWIRYEQGLGSGVWDEECLEVYGGTLFLVSGFLTCMFVVRYCLGAVESGVVKNLLQARHARRAYAGVLLVFTLVASCAMLLMGVAMVELAYATVPAPLGRAPVGEVLRWFANVLLTVVLVALLMLAIAFATGSYATAMVFGVLVPSGIAWNMLEMAGGRSVAEQAEPYLLGPNAILLSQGVVPGVAWTLVALAGIAGAAVVLTLVLRRKNLA